MTTPVHGRTTRPRNALERWLVITLIGALMAAIPAAAGAAAVGQGALVVGGLGMIVTLARD